MRKAWRPGPKRRPGVSPSLENLGLRPGSSAGRAAVFTEPGDESFELVMQVFGRTRYRLVADEKMRRSVDPDLLRQVLHLVEFALDRVARHVRLYLRHVEPE